MSDIVERLRDLNVHVVCQAAFEAADTIATLRLRVERLEGALDDGNPPLGAFLAWLSGRMVGVYKEDYDTDFVAALRRHSDNIRAVLAEGKPTKDET